jgi:hypothetical protein
MASHFISTASTSAVEASLSFPEALRDQHYKMYQRSGQRWAERTEFDSRKEQDIFLYSSAGTGSGAHAQGHYDNVQWPGCETDHWPPSSAEINKCGAKPPYPHDSTVWCLVNYAQRRIYLNEVRSEFRSWSSRAISHELTRERRAAGRMNGELGSGSGRNEVPCRVPGERQVPAVRITGFPDKIRSS